MSFCIPEYVIDIPNIEEDKEKNPSEKYIQDLIPK